MTEDKVVQGMPAKIVKLKLKIYAKIFYSELNLMNSSNFI